MCKKAEQQPVTGPWHRWGSVGVVGLLALGLSGCDALSSDDDDEDGSGYVQFYNGSANAPSLYLTVSDASDEDDDGSTFSGVAFGKVSSAVSFDSDDYLLDLGWKDADGDLESFYEQTVGLSNDKLKLMVLAESIQTPQLLEYTINIEDLDDDEDIFSLHLLNLAQNDPQPLDIYLSLSNETFNEAELVGQYGYQELSSEQAYDNDDYTLYITAAGSEQVLYQSDEISFNFTSQYIVVVRDNTGPGGSPYMVDKLLRGSGGTAYAHLDSDASYRVYNAINQHSLLPQYQGSVNVYLDGIDASPEISALQEGQFSQAFAMASGDYSLDFTNPSSDEVVSQNHLMTLNSNEDRTVFVFLKEETEEDDDGEEETTVAINTLVVDNSTVDSVYAHQINVVNMVDDYDSLKFYFVLSDETIDSASNALSNSYASNSTISLYNNTYSVYAIGTEDSTDYILGSLELTLDETSVDSFLIVEEDANASSGYQLTVAPQQGD
ncbi:hypothetical protein [uncultured Ferrimonas sp.]|uniref:hypothetical protein n=1 Tax=uncultured Ferrimonas sp. TaxID=432640 RepID=UPI00261AA754|nr:hypothetical protein [uncultured Ferrimonas sp.]